MIEQNALLDMTSDIVSAYVSNHTVRPSEIADLISTVHASLTGIGVPTALEEPVSELKPAVPIKKSVTDEYIISLEDGRKFKSMKRYLSLLGMTPEDYRRKWSLPADYPMVAPGYAAKRSALARAAGLGRSAPVEVLDSVSTAAGADAAWEAAAPNGTAAQPAQVAAEPEASPPANAPVKRRGRPKKAV